MSSSSIRPTRSAARTAGATLLVAVTVIVACDPDAVLRPDDASLALSPAEVDAITLTYVCGNRFRVRNPNDEAVPLRYYVVQTDEQADLLVPARDPAVGYADVEFTTVNVGTVRLYLTTRSKAIETTDNLGTTCPQANVPAVAPDSVPWQVLTQNVIPSYPYGTGNIAGDVLEVRTTQNRRT